VPAPDSVRAMSAAALPYRSPSPARPVDLPLPPARMPMLRGGRPLKRWRYVGVYGPELMLCVGAARIGPSRQAWWAIWDREGRAMHEHTLLGRFRGVALDPGSVHVRDRRAVIDLALEEGEGIETVSAHGAQHIWTRKQGGVRAVGRVEVGGRTWELDSVAVIDDSAGYHARHTAWSWSAGVGVAADGRPVAWNLVAGVHDSPRDSERTVWVDGEPAEVPVAEFATDLSSVSLADGTGLRFSSEAVRERNDNLLVFSSRYVQPFGTFSGTLPGAGELREGYGVMEAHDVRW